MSPAQIDSKVSFDMDIDLNSIDLKRIILIGMDFVDIHRINKSYRIIYGLSKRRILNKSIQDAVFIFDVVIAQPSAAHVPATRALQSTPNSEPLAWDQCNTKVAALDGLAFAIDTDYQSLCQS